MANVLKQHLINMLEAMDFICQPAIDWMNKKFPYQADYRTIYRRLLEEATDSYILREWLLNLYENLGMDMDDPAEEAISLLWHHVQVNPLETEEEWREVLERMPDADEVLECIILRHMDWEEEQQYLEGEDDG